ncbi:MAG: TolC family protein [Pirellulaceae bacterium]
MLATLAGCSREHYRLAADRDAYSILDEKAAHTPWQAPSTYDVEPDPLSRFYDPTSPTDPLLPPPAPQLYAYHLPSMPETAHPPATMDAPVHEEQPYEDGNGGRPEAPRRLPPITPAGGPGWFHGSLQTSGRRAGSLALDTASHRLDTRAWARHSQNGNRLRASLPASSVRPASFDAVDAAYLSQADAVESVLEPPEERAAAESEGGLRIQPLPIDAWESMPASCMLRMFEFASVREEYTRTYGAEPSRESLDDSPRLTLEDIVYLASINSREYQSQKETLYRVALRLSLERYDYELRFSTSNNRIAPNYTHTNIDGISQSTLAVPSSLQTDKLLATGGDVLARFANNVVLTFNGPQGFAADITSDLLVNFSQTVFQRDIVFEPLTQAERNVVYAARDFTRFRKTLFDQLAADYYGLLQTYRQVDIQSQNYFSLVRSHDQRQAEFRAGQRSPIEVDQVEQDVLRGRSTLIRNCNTLEGALDRLKIRMGLPTETPVNLDLSELEKITRDDELAVRGELIRRVRHRLLTERTIREVRDRDPNRAVLLASSIMLMDRMLASLELQDGGGEDTLDVSSLRIRRARLQVDVARSNLREQREALAQREQRGALSQRQKQDALDPPRDETVVDPGSEVVVSVTVLFQRTLELNVALYEFAQSQMELIKLLDVDVGALAQHEAQLKQANAEFLKFEDELSELMETSEQIPELLNRAGRMQQAWVQLVESGDALLGAPEEPLTPEQERTQTLEEVDRLLEESKEVLTTISGGLVPIEIDVDDAMMTALVLRLDLMNERGSLADDWRAIKLAADELKSVLNLNASQALTSRQDINNIADTTIDTSQTQVRLSFDAPLNRRSQRNNFRQELIDYQAALRGLMQLEDNTKLAVRNGLRDLALAREQFLINIASAALAYDRVTSTELSLRLGLDVNTRDFLEAQQAYTEALSQVANEHFAYITRRTRLFLDMELLTVGDDDFWHDLYSDDLQPSPYYQLPSYALPAYGELPGHIWYSHAIRRMAAVPTGISAVNR